MSSAAPEMTLRERVRLPGARREVSAADLALFHRTLAGLCRSEMPLPRALRAAATDVSSPALAEAVCAMADDVERGTPVAEAYAARADRFPRVYRGLIEAGIASGDLAGTLDEIAAHADAEAAIRKKLRRALAGPLLTAAFVVVAGALLGVFIAPTLMEFSSRASPNDWASVAGGGDWFDEAMQHPLFPAMIFVAALALAGTVIFLNARLRRPHDGASGVTSARFRTPILGRIRLYGELSSLAATLSLLVRRGVPAPHAFELAAEAVEEPALRARVAALATRVEAGEGIGETVTGAEVFAPSLAWIVASAERRGTLADAFGQVSSIYRERLDRAVDRTALWAGPLCECVVGVVILLIAYGFLGELMHSAMKILSYRG